MATKDKRDNGNAVELADPAFVGVAPEYKGFSSVGQQPFVTPDGEPGADQEAAQVEHEARMAKGVGFQGFSTDGTHPTERLTPQGKRLAEDEIVRQANVKSAKEFLAEDQADDPEPSDEDEQGEATEPAAPPVV